MSRQPGAARRGSAATASAGVGTRPGGGGPPSEYARLVLDQVEQVPAGAVVTYGDVAELMGRGTGRTVGTVMARHGREVAWWRVVQASGRPAEPHVREALERLRAEGCPTTGDVVDLARARWAGPVAGGADSPGAGRDRSAAGSLDPT